VKIKLALAALVFAAIGISQPMTAVGQQTCKQCVDTDPGYFVFASCVDATGGFLHCATCNSLWCGGGPLTSYCDTGNNEACQLTLAALGLEGTFLTEVDPLPAAVSERQEPDVSTACRALITQRRYSSQRVAAIRRVTKHIVVG